MENKNISQYTTLFQEAWEEREHREKDSKEKLSFGVSYLDDALIGICKKDLVVIAGRSGQGKSELALHISMTNALAGKKVVHIALEAEKYEVTRRMLFKKLAKDFYEDKTRFTKEKPNYARWYDYQQESIIERYYNDALTELKKADGLKILYRPEEFGLQQLSTVFATFKNGDADLIVLDHLHYMDIADDARENTAYNEIIKTVRNLALSYSIPVVCVAHIRKKAFGDKNIVPEMEEIHGSSDIYKVATKVVTIAPGDSTGIDHTSFPTYMKACKNRSNGAVTRYIGLTIFNIAECAYNETYMVGKQINSEFIPETIPPDWAKNHRST